MPHKIQKQAGQLNLGLLILFFQLGSSLHLSLEENYDPGMSDSPSVGDDTNNNGSEDVNSNLLGEILFMMQSLHR